MIMSLKQREIKIKPRIVALESVALESNLLTVIKEKLPKLPCHTYSYPYLFN